MDRSVKNAIALMSFLQHIKNIDLLQIGSVATALKYDNGTAVLRINLGCL